MQINIYTILAYFQFYLREKSSLTNSSLIGTQLVILMLFSFWLWQNIFLVHTILCEILQTYGQNMENIIILVYQNLRNVNFVIRNQILLKKYNKCYRWSWFPLSHLPQFSLLHLFHWYQCFPELFQNWSIACTFIIFVFTLSNMSVYKQLIELAYMFEIHINGITWFILLQLFSLNFMLWVLPTLKYTELIHSHPSAWNQYMNVPKSINSFCFFFFTTKNNAATSTLTNILNKILN